jgi:sodium-dependent dicarboxylate transporter 2/3/5
MNKNRFFIVLGPALFVILLIVGAPDGMSAAAWAALAGTLWIAVWWVSEAIPIPVTSLLPLVLFPITGVMDMTQTARSYSQPIIFLFMGGFILALAMERWNLHRRIALSIISLVGTNQRQILLGFVIAAGFLSMWISNTATTVMMLPIALSIIGQFRGFASDEVDVDLFGKALVLTLAYSASIGGMATLVGTPTNLIFAQSVREFYGVEIAFDRWLLIGLPLSVTLLGVCWWHMSHVAFRLSHQPVEGSREIIQRELRGLGDMSGEEKWVLSIFCLVAFCWITRRYLITPLFPAVNDINIVLIGALLLYVLPAPSRKGEKLMDWQTTLKLPWGVLLLFGGAFAVAAAFEASGLAQWIGDQLALLQKVPFWLILLVIVGGVNFLTEITQNVATCTLMMPIIAALTPVIGVHPYGLMAATTIAASCAFMLPVATAPNAVIFGSGFLHIRDMVRAGFLLNILSIMVISLFCYFLLPLLWGIEMRSYPEVLE